MMDKKSSFGFLYLVAVIAVLFLVVYGSNRRKTDSEIYELETVSSDNTDSSLSELFYVKSRSLNVREAPNLSSSVVDNLSYREQVLVHKLDSTGDWGVISNGWVYMDLLSKIQPPALPDLEILSIDIKRLGREYGYTDYSWIVKVRNNTSYSKKFNCRVVFFDKDGFELDYDFESGFYLMSGKEDVFSGKTSLKNNLADVFDKYTISIE